MAIERKWPAAGPFYLAAPGTSKGQLVIPTTTGLHVKQKLQLIDSNDPSLNLALEIKRIIGPTVEDVNSTMTVEVGLPGTSITSRADVSAYIAASCYIFAPEQTRSDIPLQEIERYVYDEEPSMAQRTIGVDPRGQYITPENPNPVALFGQQITILNNLLAMQVGGVSPSSYLINNEGFFIFDNEGNFIEAQ